jgi:hypothetical protein
MNRKSQKPISGQKLSLQKKLISALTTIGISSIVIIKIDNWKLNRLD